MQSNDLVPHGFGFRPEGDRRFICRYRDTTVGKVQAFSALQRLSGNMVRSGTAAALDAWCREHGLAAEPTLALRLVPQASAPFTDDVRQSLELEDEGSARYRRVEMSCGDLLLGWAETWYVPRRLTPAVGESLAADVLFEQAADQMRPVRIGVQNTLLWAPLRVGEQIAAPTAAPRERHGSKSRPLVVPWRVFEHRTLLRNKGLHPMSLTLETFTREVLGSAVEPAPKPQLEALAGPAPLKALAKP
ncbi:hypothetical protein [Chelatococcus reniformis]|nr:hypothetical protein [Chelatococcus reniformis]